MAARSKPDPQHAAQLERIPPARPATTEAIAAATAPDSDQIIVLVPAPRAARRG